MSNDAAETTELVKGQDGLHARVLQRHANIKAVSDPDPISAADVRALAPCADRPLHRSKLSTAELTDRERKAKSVCTKLKGLLPIIDWLPKYGKDNLYYDATCTSKGEGLRRDMIAGLVIGVMLVPQGMAYAMLAGLPPIYGLYSSTWNVMAYAFFGTCKLLGPGVNAPISLMV
jgi:hypothetical protein